MEVNDNQLKWIEESTDELDIKPLIHEKIKSKKAGFCKRFCSCNKCYNELTFNQQIIISTSITLVFAFLFLFIVVLINVMILKIHTYDITDNEINKIYLETFKDLGREVSASLNMPTIITENMTNRYKSLLISILSQTSTSNYPLDWTQFSALPLVSGTTTQASSIFSGLNVTYTQMTYIVPTGASSVTSNPVLNQLNALNMIWTQANLIRIGYNSDVDATRLFIMLEENDGSGVTKQILATMPGQYFTQTITSSEFSSLSWYKEALSNQTKLVKILKQNDPFYGGMDFAVGFCKGFSTGNFKGVIGFHYNLDVFKKLISPLFGRSGATQSIYIYNPSSLLLQNDTNNILELSPDIKTKATTNSLFTDREVFYDVFASGSGYNIGDIQFSSFSGSAFKMSLVLCPFTKSGTTLSDYDYEIVLFQTNNEIQSISQQIESDVINPDFGALIGYVILAIFLLCCLIGITICYYSWKKSKKQHKIEDIRKTIRNDDLFKNFVTETKKYKKNKEFTRDEIEVLLTLFYNFFIEESKKKKKEPILICSSDFPSNPYYNPSTNEQMPVDNPNDANGNNENINDSNRKDDPFFNQNDEDEKSEKNYSGSNELSNDEEDKDPLFQKVDPKRPLIRDEEDEDQFTEDILPPISIDWKSIINDYIKDLGY